MRPFDLFVKWMVEHPEQSHETRGLFLKTPVEVAQDARQTYTREAYPRTVFSKIAQNWVVEEERPAWMAYAKGKAYNNQMRRMVV